jgi:16S rRNA (guanine1207-N2)-methyltransferase
MADPTGAEADFSHYFTDPGDRRPRRPRPVEVVVDGHRRTLTSEAGVFAHGALDEGTALRAPRARVWALDTNPRAVELCARNATACGLDNVTAHPVEADPPLGGLDPGVTFDAVWSNPPVRIGKQALHLLLTAALERLRPGGTAHLVVHKHLGSDSLQRWLGSQGHPTTRRLSRGGYRLLDVGPVGT